MYKTYILFFVGLPDLCYNVRVAMEQKVDNVRTMNAERSQAIACDDAAMCAISPPPPPIC